MEALYRNAYTVTRKGLVSLAVYNAGFEKCIPLHQWGPGVRDHYLIHYIIQGKGYYHVDGKCYELGAGDTFLVYPETVIYYYADENDPWEYGWVGFNGSDASMILKATDFSPSEPVLFNIEFKEELKNCLLNIYETGGNSFINAVETTGHLYQALCLFMKHASVTEQHNTVSSHVQSAIAYISANYSYPITIEDIAHYVGVSRSHLFRSFETVMKQSPKEYLTDFRLKQACYLLEHSNFSIATIANSIGFDNSLYFSKHFHKHMGMSPKEYRQKHSS